MASMEEISLCREIRRQMDRKPIDSVQLELQVVRGCVHMSGIIRQMRSDPKVDVRGEIDDVIRLIYKMRGVKQVTCECRVKNLETKEEKEQAEGRKEFNAMPNARSADDEKS